MKLLTAFFFAFAIAGVSLLYVALNPPKLKINNFTLTVVTSEEEHRALEEWVRSGNFTPIPGAETGQITSTEYIDGYWSMEMGIAVTCLGAATIIGIIMIVRLRRGRKKFSFRQKAPPSPPIQTGQKQSLLRLKEGTAKQLDRELGLAMVCQSVISRLELQGYGVYAAEQFLREVERHKERLKPYAALKEVTEALSEGRVSKALEIIESRRQDEALIKQAEGLGINITNELQTGRRGDATKRIAEAIKQQEKARQKADRHRQTAELFASIDKVDGQYRDQLKRLHAAAVQAIDQSNHAFIKACYAFERYFDTAKKGTRLRPTRRAS